MTAPVKAASNGAETTEPAPQRKTGMAHVHEAEAYHTATLAHDAAFEAERLCSDIYRAVSGATGTAARSAKPPRRRPTRPPSARPGKPSNACTPPSGICGP